MLSGNDDVKFPIIKEININNLASETKIPVSISSLWEKLRMGII